MPADMIFRCHGLPPLIPSITQPFDVTPVDIFVATTSTTEWIKYLFIIFFERFHTLAEYRHHHARYARLVYAYARVCRLRILSHFSFRHYFDAIIATPPLMDSFLLLLLTLRRAAIVLSAMPRHAVFADAAAD